MWTEALVAYIKLLLRYLSGGTEGNNQNSSQETWSPGRYSQKELPEYEAEAESQRLGVTLGYLRMEQDSHMRFGHEKIR